MEDKTQGLCTYTLKTRLPGFARIRDEWDLNKHVRQNVGYVSSGHTSGSPPGHSGAVYTVVKDNKAAGPQSCSTTTEHILKFHR